MRNYVGAISRQVRGEGANSKTKCYRGMGPSPAIAQREIAPGVLVRYLYVVPRPYRVVGSSLARRWPVVDGSVACPFHLQKVCNVCNVCNLPIWVCCARCARCALREGVRKHFQHGVGEDRTVLHDGPLKSGPLVAFRHGWDLVWYLFRPGNALNVGFQGGPRWPRVRTSGRSEFARPSRQRTNEAH
jgi:hypothetical protein